MKKISFILLSLLGVSFFGQAKVLTVSNNTNSPGQYTDLQVACDAAAINDTIYIHASEKDYGSIFVRKPLVLIGEGTLPNQQMLLRAYVSSITFTHAVESISTITSSGSQVHGLHAQFFIGANKDNLGLGGFTFQRCKGLITTLSGSYSISNLEINQFVGYINLGTRLSNSVISNSILTTIGWMEADNSLINKSSNNILRNSILGNNCSIYGAVVVNNIFYDPSVNQNIVTKNSTYTNNLFYYKTTASITNGTTTATGNIVNQDPKFVNPESLPSLVAEYSFGSQGPFANFTLSAGSPALTLGTDGTQAGLYGGTTPWIDGGEGVFRYGTMPSLVPYVTDMDILNTSVPLNGNLKVSIKAKVQQ